jgi:glutamyl-tRNA reductase
MLLPFCQDIDEPPLTNKLLHTPSAQLRQAGFNGQVELLEAANTLFQLKKFDNNP